jgi:hypothetical protein
VKPREIRGCWKPHTKAILQCGGQWRQLVPKFLLICAIETPLQIFEFDPADTGKSDTNKMISLPSGLDCHGN